VKDIHLQDKLKVDQEAARIIIRSVSEIIKKKEICILAIPGGKSVSGIFKLIKETQEIPWGKVHIFMVDERMVSINDDNSNFKLANDTFIGELTHNGKLPKQNVHPFKVEQGIESYQKELERLGGKYDIILLSAGEDGHVGALFSNHHSIRDKSPFFITMDDSPKPPPERMTSSRLLLEKADTAILLFYGEGKKEAYKKFRDEKVTIEDLPTKLVKNIKNSFVISSF
jgi:6-phosphogluconolactonase